MDESTVAPTGHIPVLGNSALPQENTSVQVRIPTCGDGNQMVVKVNKEGDIVRSIDISCPCGRIVQVACQYDDPSASA